MEQFDLHVCLVSGQAMPNILPVFSKNFKPKEVVLLVSEAMQTQAGYLKELYKNFQIKVSEILLKDAYDIAEIESKLQALRDEHYGQSIALNVTGGTKLMAIAAQKVFADLDLPVFYVQPDTSEILMVSPTYSRNEIESSIRLENYLLAHGFKIENEVCRQLPDLKKHVDLTQKILASIGRYSDAIGTVNKWISDAGKNVELRLSIAQHDLGSNVKDLLDLYQEYGLLTWNRSAIQFKDEKSRVYINGGWLEEYVFAQLNKVSGIQDKACNLQVVREDAKANSKGKNNEFDIAFIARNHLHIIECKTKNMKAEHAGSDETVYKLDSLAGVGGLMTKKYLISYKELDAATKTRAKDLGVFCISGKELQNLGARLQSWVHPVK